MMISFAAIGFATGAYVGVVIDPADKWEAGIGGGFFGSILFVMVLGDIMGVK